MKKLTIGIAIAIGVIATAGQIRNPKNPLPVNGTTIQADWPEPVCPPICSEKK